MLISLLVVLTEMDNWMQFLLSLLDKSMRPISIFSVVNAYFKANTLRERQPIPFSSYQMCWKKLIKIISPQNNAPIEDKNACFQVFAMTVNEGLVDKIKLDVETIASIMPLAKDASLQKGFFSFLNNIALTDEWLQCMLSEKMNVVLVEGLKNLNGPHDLASVSLLLNWIMHGIYLLILLIIKLS